MQDNAQLKQAAMTIFRAGLASADPLAAVRRCLAREGETLVLCPGDGPDVTFDLEAYDRILVVGAGKASARMCLAVEEILGARVTEGLINVKYDHGADTSHVAVVEAGHPVPDEQGLAGTQAMVTLLDSASERTLVLSLISGGGSALLPLPAEGITLGEKQAITGQLLSAGADIGEMNAVRKHISAVKGGQLARRAAPATMLTLMLSDVVGDRLDVIASGPTVPDASTYADAQAVLTKYGLWETAPAGVRTRLSRGAAGELPETPKADDPVFERCTNQVIGSNIVALRACERAARELGFNTLVLSSIIEGETRDVARMHAAIGLELRTTSLPIAPPACVISGGETTVTIRGSGRGGRNQEFALAAALDIAGAAGLAIFSGGTDGTDGPTDAAGAIAFGDTVARAADRGRAATTHLDDNDAYPFFDSIDDLIRTGPTGTNVMDIHLVLVS